jgi:hypothetical protein
MCKSETHVIKSIKLHLTLLSNSQKILNKYNDIFIHVGN